MKSIIATAVLLTVLCPVTIGAQDRQHMLMMAEMQILQQQQAQLSLKIDQLTVTLTDALKTLNARVDQAGQDSLKRFADQGLTLGQIDQQLRVIREQSQGTGTRIGQLQEEVRALRRDISTLISRSQTLLTPPVPVDPLDPNAPPPDVAAEPPALPPLPSNLGLSPGQLFNTAMSDYAGGQYTSAISGFEAFIREFSDSENADNAQLYIGDAQTAQGRFEEAIAAYNRVIQNYPMGDQVPWAYYKRALALSRLGRSDEVRASYEMAIKTSPSPESEVAVLARNRLNGLPPATPPK